AGAAPAPACPAGAPPCVAHRQGRPASPRDATAGPRSWGTRPASRRRLLRGRIRSEATIECRADPAIHALGHADRDVLVQQAGEDLLGGSAAHHAAFGHGFAHQLHQLVQEHALELRARAPQPCIRGCIVPVRRSARRRHRAGDARARPHRLTPVAAGAPVRCSDSRIAAISWGTAPTACSAAATSCTVAPASSRMPPGTAPPSTPSRYGPAWPPPIVSVMPAWLTTAPPTRRSPPAT